MAILSLNGNFNYPIELKQSLSVDGNATFNSAFSQGIGNFSNGQHSFTCGDSCTADSDYSMAYGRESYVGAGGQYAYAGGVSCSAYGENSYAIGYKTATCLDNGTNCGNSFVWQGNINGNVYRSKGNGTFCINPYNSIGTDALMPSSIAVCGFFIGDYCITDFISSESAKRILTNENCFTASQEFCADVVFDRTTLFKDQNTFDGSVILNGSTSVPGNNEPQYVITDTAIANHNYVNGMALSSVTTIGQYYPENDNISQTDFNSLAEYATPLRFVETYVTSALNHVTSFIDESNMDSAASRQYSFNFATSAAQYLLDRNNEFTGTNTFRNAVDVVNSFTSRGSATVDLRNGNILVKEPLSEAETLNNTIATERFTRSVATSGVKSVIDGSNTYTGYNSYSRDTSFYGNVAIYSTISLNNNAVANFNGGTLYIKEPVATSMNRNEPSTTYFSRSVALSAINTLLNNGGTFNGKVTFNGGTVFNKTIDLESPNGVQLYVKTQNLADSSKSAASTKFVDGLITQTISTSSVSVKKLMLDGNASSKVNDFTTTNNFLHENIYVSTMDDGCDDTHAASCEFVTRVPGGIKTFDLFDMKFMDYVLPESSAWKMNGTYLYKANGFDEVYQHILADKNAGVAKSITINGVGVDYYQAPDGHKIVMSSNASKLDTLFSKTGIAWFYVLNTTRGGEYIRLPRSSYNFNISTSDVGAYIEPSLPSHTHTVSVPRSADGSHGDGSAAHHGGSSHCSTIGLTTSAPNSSIYKSGSTVQPPATKMFLYFYCG